MIRELQTLTVVARTGSFAAAGDVIGLTQGAVSLQMKRLESHLGLTLFDRTGRSAILNATGERVVAGAGDIIERWQRLGQPPSAQGVLKIGAISSAHSRGLIPVLAKFHSEWPQVRLQVSPAISLNLLGQVDSGEIDLAVMIRPPFELPADLCWHPLYQESIRLLIPQGMNPNTGWREILQTASFIRYDRSSFGGRLIDQFLLAQGIKVDDRFEFDEIGAISAAVQAGLGVALLPLYRDCVPEGVKRVTAVDLVTPHREIGILTRRQAQENPLVSGIVRLFQRETQNA